MVIFLYRNSKLKLNYTDTALVHSDLSSDLGHSQCFCPHFDNLANVMLK